MPKHLFFLWVGFRDKMISAKANSPLSIPVDVRISRLLYLGVKVFDCEVHCF